MPLTAKRLVQLATRDGAIDLGIGYRVLGIADRSGSLTPGKRAGRFTALNFDDVLR